jgi:hypothetical protein
MRMVAPFPRSFLVWMSFSLYYTKESQENHENFPILFTGRLKKHPLYSSRYLLLRRSVTPHLVRGGISTEQTAGTGLPAVQEKEQSMQDKRFTGVIPRTMLVLIVGLIVLSSGLFVTGVLIEHTGGSTSAAVSPTPGQAPSTTQDPDGGHESTSSSPSSSKVQAGPKQETVFGLDLENPWFVAAFVLGWLVLVAALIRFGRITLPVVLLVAIVATVLDAGEVMRQIGEAKSTVAVLAVLVAVAHLALAVLALLVLTRSTQHNTVQST